MIKQQKNQIKQAYIPDIYGKERRKSAPGKEGKLGVEGMCPDVIEQALRNAGATVEGESQTRTAGNITKQHLVELGLSGGRDSKEKRLLPLLYMIDDVEKWNDINELRKSNPNLGVSVSVDYMLEEIRIAEGSLSKRAEFITKYCCLKQNSSTACLPLSSLPVALMQGPMIKPI